MCKCLSNSWLQEGPLKCWGCEEEKIFLSSLGPFCKTMRLSPCCNTYTLQCSLLRVQWANDSCTVMVWNLGQLCRCLNSLPGSWVTVRQRQLEDLEIQERFSLGLWLQVQNRFILLCFSDMRMVKQFFLLECPQAGWALIMLCQDLPQIPRLP